MRANNRVGLRGCHRIVGLSPLWTAIPNTAIVTIQTMKSAVKIDSSESQTNMAIPIVSIHQVVC